MTEYRKEKDLLGELDVPSNVYYGIQTLRAINNFPLLGEKRICDYPALIESLVQIKKAASIANANIHVLSDEIAQLICKSADTILNKEMFAQFPIHRFHGGGGTSANMNANEVIANLANEMAGSILGSYVPVDPNEHVNLNQSTNDVYPSACHLAIIKKWPLLKHQIVRFIETIDKIGEEWKDTKKISRTCLQDAVVINYGDFFSGYSGLLKRSLQRIDSALKSIYYLNIGGTIVGDRKTVTTGYIESFIQELRKITGEPELKISGNLFDSAQNPDDMVNISVQLNLLARGLIKIAKDIRLMSSGPQTGFGEISIPEMQPGSSIMPGKINPVIPEFLIQLCFEVIGKNEAVQMTVDHGELELNIYESTILFNVIDQIDLLTNGIDVFNTKCFSGITVNLEKNSQNLETPIALITELMRLKGYKYASKVYKTTGGNTAEIKKHLNL